MNYTNPQNYYGSYMQPQRYKLLDSLAQNQAASNSPFMRAGASSPYHFEMTTAAPNAAATATAAPDPAQATKDNNSSSSTNVAVAQGIGALSSTIGNTFQKEAEQKARAADVMAKAQQLQNQMRQAGTIQGGQFQNQAVQNLAALFRGGR